MKRSYLAFLCFLGLGVLTTAGCGTVYKVAMDERSLGTQAKDEEITMAVRKRFVDDKTLKYLDISTYCYNGLVYLVGAYETLDQKNRAVKLAKEVEGVKSVTDHFLPKKKNDPCGTKKNLELVARVKTELIKDKDIWSTNIEVKAVQCHIILLGLVGSQKEVSEAIAHAKSVEGVRSVASYLKAVK